MKKGVKLTRHATVRTNSLCSKREAGDTAEARASASSSGTSSTSASGHFGASAVVGSSTFSRDCGGGGSRSGFGSGADAGSSSDDVGGRASSVLGDSQLHEVGLGLCCGGVDREGHALAAVGALLAVEPC